MRRLTSTRFLFAVALVAVLCITSLADACPGCKENLASGKPGVDGQPIANVAQGFAWSIYLMLGAVVSVLGAMGGAMFVFLRKAAKRGQI